MNSYGDSQTPRARASVPGANGGSAPDDDRYPGSSRPDAYRRGAGGRASVAGSASVGGTGSVGGRASVGSASVGSASVGSARVGGTASVGGRASVGSASVGSASVGSGPAGRASVRPSPGFGSFGTAGGPDDEPPARGKDKSKAAKRRRRTNILTAAAAVVVIMLGAGVVGGTYFFDSVELPPPTTEDQSNVILDSKGTVLAKLGEQNRTVVPEEKINKYVKDAVVAAEDKNFYDHHGIDMKGIVRAAWNNFTGGATQGASTITQQYARHVADLKDISINRKLREAVIARKLESQYKKNQILGMYLNFIYLGQGRYGIEAAAQGYFGKSVLTPIDDPKAITPYEAAVLASIIKQPEPSSTHPGYDPTYGLAEAKDRWEYTLGNMLEMKAISQQQFDQRKYPSVRPRGQATKNALSKPVGMIMRHVRAELATMGISQQEFDKGGLTVTTTIDPGVQKAAEDAGSRKSKESRMAKKPKTYQAAVIGIDPETGRVLGYYGGDDPNGIDYGGYMSGDGTKITGGQSPGSTMKIYTLAAALKEDISFDTVWDGTKRRANGKKINNAGAEDSGLCQGKPTYCDLEYATVKSYNFPFYWIADGIGREKVIEAAKNAGLKHMFTDGNEQFPNGKLVDLTKTDKSTWLKEGYFDNEVAFGQYRVVPLEHAEGVATIVSGGVHHNAHFIKSVKQVDADTGKTVIRGREKIDGNRVFAADQMSNLQGVMKKIVEVDDRDLRNGREAIAKSGTWEFNDGKDKRNGSGDCWFVGGIPQLAATVWVGGAGNKVELKDGGKDMFGAGTPSLIWRDFLNAATKAMDIKKEDFPTRVKTGNDNSPFANGKRPPEPDPTQNQNDCLFGVVGNCGPNNGQNPGPGNGQNPGNGNGQNPGPGNGQNPGPGNGNGNGNGGGAVPTFPADQQNGDNDDGD